MPRRPLSISEAEIAEYHALSVKPDPSDLAMDDLLRIEKSRLIERHQAEVGALRSDISGWERHASELGDEIRRQRRVVDRLYLLAAGVVMACLYLYVRDAGCSVAWWGR